MAICCALLTGSWSPPVAAAESYFNFQVIKGQRRTCVGLMRRYDLYCPQSRSGEPKEPFPVVVLVHGFMRQSKHMRRNAEYLAQRGIAVFVPNMDQILLGYKRRGKNMDEVIDHVQWLLTRAADKNDPLSKQLDPARVGIMGHSSGGPISIEATIGLQKRGFKIDSMCQVDGIVWKRTMDRLDQLQPLDLLSVRSESAICNQHASVLRLLEKLSFAYKDMKVNNSKHCDPENPTNWGCMCICGPSHDRYRNIFVRILYVYFKERLRPPSTPDSGATLADTLVQYELANAVTRGKGWQDIPFQIAHPMMNSDNDKSQPEIRSN